MRFANAHKVATYLMVGCAYLALIAGGGVSPLIAFGGAVGLVASWWWEAPHVRLERWSLLWTFGSIIALVYSALTAVASADFLGVGAEFLIWLIVAKAFNRKSARDWQQMYLLAFLMLVAGSVLNPDLTYGVCFLGFVIASTWALTLFHLRREMEDNLLVKHAADRASEGGDGLFHPFQARGDQAFEPADSQGVELLADALGEVSCVSQCRLSFSVPAEKAIGAG